MAQLKQKSLCE